MLISRTQPLILPKVPRHEWREPSIALPKDQFGNQNHTRFILELWKRDGGLVDHQRFDDRDEFDYALYRVLIEEPHPDLVPLWATQQVLTSPTGSNQTWTRPSDWNNSDNSIEGIGAGGAGARRSADNVTNSRATGGAGGAWAIRNNYAAAASETYQIASGPSGGSSTYVSGGTGASGTAGGDTWFGAATLASATMGAKGGEGGQQGTGSISGATGGQAASCIGDSASNGGDSGAVTNGSLSATGGGGAGGPNGAGGNSAAITISSDATDGAQGDNGTGGTGGAGSTSANGTAGNPGTEITGAEGSGGGGGAATRSNAGTTSGTGGLYGAGSGAACTRTPGPSTATAAAGRQGIVIVTYTPSIAITANGNFLALF